MSSVLVVVVLFVVTFCQCGAGLVTTTTSAPPALLPQHISPPTHLTTSTHLTPTIATPPSHPHQHYTPTNTTPSCSLPMAPNAKVKASGTPIIECILQPQRAHRGVYTHPHTIPIPGPRLATHPSRVPQHACTTVQVTSIISKDSTLGVLFGNTYCVCVM